MKNNNKIIYAQGGIGNQLFQYVFYKMIKNTNPLVRYDIGRVNYDQQHSGVNIIDFIGNDNFLCSVNNDLPLEIKDSFFSKVYRFILRKLKIKSLKNTIYDYDALTVLNEINTDLKFFIGYFQFVDAALSVKDELESLFFEKNKNDILKLKHLNKKYTGLHIRRGDFVTSSSASHKVLSMDFIEKAISAVEGQIMVFSDDIKWCKNNLPLSERICFYEGDSAIDDFIALTQCSNYILSGSTFSWWAAFLFSNDKTQVIIPRNHNAQFMSNSSNQKLEWKVRCL
ncbi:putative glycosyl transferase [Photobacterium leiognathi lrivu.4.1]|uniref:Putative glycosyl transferase n=1 Tax=Photobacterium leiognathi lrivu.4.1 TaxID=1248232 RepID=X0NXP9_PHOLE|nr:alpha-1,2-fucosyltransferase [Photobacterium leiognathi]GAD28975.1 putative glycosyl transferase [Photobacterium leiognathi lrivu.4.1]